MKLFKHIVCPYDNSDFAKKALDYAAKLALNNGEQLTVLYVMVNPFIFEGGNPILSNNVLAIDLLDKMRQEENEQLEKIKNEIKQAYPGVMVNVALLESNDIGDAINEFQKSSSADLVVMGSHGRKGIKRFILGSVAEAVLRSLECPILIVK
jgi:nucleotide-binding universal stress UspA family protein